MNAELRRMTAAMSDSAVLRLAVAVQQELTSESSDSAFARLSSTEAEHFLVAVDNLRIRMRSESDAAGHCAIAREFLHVLLRTDAFDELITQAAMSSGVRGGIDDIVGWFKGSFNLASLVGLRFEYVSEKKEVRRTEDGSIETSRTIRVGLGSTS